MRLVRQVTPGALVRMGLPLDKAKQLTDRQQHVVTTTRKQ